MTEHYELNTLGKANSSHLSIELVEMGVPNKHTTDKINADLNEDLLGNNKYSQGKKEYLSVSVFRRLLNEAFDMRWSWEILTTQMMGGESEKFAMVTGRLYLPGLGFRDGVGTALMNKKDNSAGFAVATSNAFKNALKQSGFGASLLDDEWEEELFDEDFEEEEEAPAPKKEAPKKAAPKKEAPPKKEKKEAPSEEAPKKAAGPEYSTEQKAAIAELKEIYNIESTKELLGFMQIWKKDLKSLKSVTPEQLDAFLTYYDENEDEFEDFDPEEVA